MECINNSEVDDIIKKCRHLLTQRSRQSFEEWRKRLVLAFVIVSGEGKKEAQDYLKKMKEGKIPHYYRKMEVLLTCGHMMISIAMLHAGFANIFF